MSTPSPLPPPSKRTNCEQNPDDENETEIAATDGEVAAADGGGDSTEEGVKEEEEGPAAVGRQAPRLNLVNAGAAAGVTAGAVAGVGLGVNLGPHGGSSNASLVFDTREIEEVLEVAILTAHIIAASKEYHESMPKATTVAERREIRHREMLQVTYIGGTVRG